MFSLNITLEYQSSDNNKTKDLNIRNNLNIRNTLHTSNFKLILN